MKDLTIAEFNNMLRELFPVDAPDLVRPEEALIKLSHWKVRDFYRDSSEFWAVCNNAKLFDCCRVAGARRYAFYRINKRGTQFHNRLGALLSQRMLTNHRAEQLRLARVRRDEIVRIERDTDHEAAWSDSVYAGAM